MLKRNKRIWILLAFLLAAVGGTVLFSPRALARPVELDIFAYDNCGGCFALSGGCKPCEVIEGLRQSYYGILEGEGLEKTGVIRITNLQGGEGRALFEELCTELGIVEEDLEYPLVVLDGKTWFDGDEAAAGLTGELKKRSPGALFRREREGTATFSEGEAVYFYSEFCGDCRRASRFLEEAGEGLEAAGIRLVSHNVDVGEGYALLAQYLEDYGIGHKSVTVPYLFRGEEYAFGSDEIGAVLADWTGG